MATQPLIQIKYGISNSYTNTQNNYVGAQNVAGRRGTLPTFTDANTKYVAKTGNDTTGTGVSASPYLTIAKALSTLGGAFIYCVIKDSGVYNVSDNNTNVTLNWNVANTSLYAADGQTPTLTLKRGAVQGTYGARTSGRTQFASVAGTNNICVSKAGNDGTGVRGTFAAATANPFKTITAALSVVGRASGDVLSILDSGVYVENLPAIGTLAITIQAMTSGQLLTNIPTVVQVSGTIQVNSQTVFSPAGTLQVFGINFQTLNGSDGIDTGNGCLISDCTFLYLATAGNAKTAILVISGTTGNSTVQNCQFINITNGINAVGSANQPTTTTISNCYFTTVGNPQFSSTVGINVSAFITGCVIDSCSFVNYFSSNSTAVCVQRSFDAATALTGTDAIKNCYFNAVGNGIYYGTNSDYTTGLTNATISNHYFTAVLGSAITVFSVAATPTTFTNILCYKNTGVDFKLSFNTSEGTTKNNTVNLTHVTSIACAATSAFSAVTTGTLGVINLTANLTNVTFLNAVTAMTFNNATSESITYTLSGVIEKGSSSGTAVSETGTGISHLASYCCFEKTVPVALLATTAFNADAKLISTAASAENIALDGGVSPCVLSNGGGPTIADMGMGPAMTLISVAGITVDGITFMGDINFYNGLQVNTGNLNPTIRYCTFIGLGPVALRLTSQGTVTKCLFNSCNGQALQIGESQCVCSYNAFAACGSSAITNNSISSVNNNSTYLCLYGQVDRGVGQNVLLQNNIYSQSGSVDYFGPGQQNFSDVEVLSVSPNPVASVDANSSRSNPLFRDPDNGDLRLQTISTGFLFDSPAKGAGSDGNDMGAFNFTYGAATPASTLFTPARNPDHVIRTVKPIKLAQGDTFGGNTFSVAQSAIYQTQYDFEFDVTDMSAADLTGWQTIFTNGDGFVQVSFDGGSTFIGMHVLRNQDLVFTEISGLPYSDNTVPTPIKKISFIVSNQ